MKTKKVKDYIINCRRLSRLEEIESHSKPISYSKIFKNKKKYNRKNKNYKINNIE